MEAVFSLRQQGKSDPVIILGVFDSRFPSRKFFHSTEKSIPEDGWTFQYSKKERKAGKGTSGFPDDTPEYFALRGYLRDLQQAVRDWGTMKIKVTGKNSLNKQELHTYLENLGKQEQKAQEEKLQNESDFFKMWQHIIDTSKGTNGEAISKNTRLSKNQTLRLVRKYCIEKGITLSFTKLDMEFYHSFDRFMDTQGLKPNSKGKHIKEIKAILKEAQDRDITVNTSFTKKSFKVIRKETDNTYLTEEELKKMVALKLNASKTALRDLFVMACFTGLRHSDWHQIRQENIVTQNGVDFIKVKQKKTTDSIHIPVHPIVRIILNKYNGVPPRVISNQKFNEALKEICKHEDLKLGKVLINGKSVDKANEISTHSARRSFATNAYLSKSMSVYSIMNCTGHKTEASFLKYLKLSGLDKAQDIAQSKFFNDAGWSAMKVA